jgi:serine/threonine protein kinase
MRYPDGSTQKVAVKKVNHKRAWPSLVETHPDGSPKMKHCLHHKGGVTSRRVVEIERTAMEKLQGSERFVKYHGYHHCPSSGDWYLVSDFFDGRDLFGYVIEKETRRNTPAEYYHGLHALFIQLAEALVYAKQQGVVIRDVALENALIDHAGKTIKVVDMGQATFGDPITGVAKRPPDAVCGRERFRAPEIIVRYRRDMENCGDIEKSVINQLWADEVSFPADVFALGCMYYTMLSKAAPFWNIADAFNGYVSVGLDEIDFPPGIRPSTSLGKLINLMLGPNPRTRISIEDVLQNLQNMNSGLDPNNHSSVSIIGRKRRLPSK